MDPIDRHLDMIEHDNDFIALDDDVKTPQKSRCDQFYSIGGSCCSPLVMMRIFSVASTVLAIFSGVMRNERNYTTGDWDPINKRFTEGKYVSATLLSAAVGAFSTSAMQFFAQSNCSKLTLYQIDVVLLNMLPMLFYILAQAEQSEVNNDYSIKDKTAYEQLYNAMFCIGCATVVTGLFAIFRQAQEDDMLDLSELDALPENDADEKIKVVPNQPVDLKWLHHPRKGKKLQMLWTAQSTIKSFYRFGCIAPLAMGAVAIGLGFLSKNVDQIIAKHFTVGDEQGQAYFLINSGVILTAFSVANFLHYKLYRAIKMFNKRVSVDPSMDAHSGWQKSRVFVRYLSGQLALIPFAFAFPHGANNLGWRWFSYFCLGLKGTYEEARTIGGFESLSSVPPPDGPDVKMARAAIPEKRKILCCQLRLPRTKLEWKGFYYNNFDRMRRIAGAVFVAAGVVWFSLNAAQAEGDKRASAITAAVSIPFWYALKVWSDLTTTADSGQFKRTLKFYLTNHSGVFLQPGLLIQQLYGTINSHEEQSESTSLDYFWNCAGWASLMSGWGIIGASLNELNPSFLITLYLAVFAKMSKGEQ